MINNFDIDRYDSLDTADKKAYLNTVLNLVKSNGIQNMIDLEFFIDENGSEYGVTNSILRDVVDGKSEFYDYTSTETINVQNEKVQI